MKIVRPLSLDGIFALIAFTLGIVSPMFDPDFWWHIRVGRDVLAAGWSVPSVDTYSWTFPGQAWFAHSWLADVILLRLYEAGPLFILLLKGTIAMLSVRILAGALERRHLFVRALIVGLLTIFVVRNLNERPWLFSYLFFALYLALILRYLATGTRLIWLLPVLMTAWVNLHGGAVLGLVLLGTVGAGLLITPGERGKLVVLIPIGLLTVAAMLVANPRGADYFEYVLQYTGGSYHKRFITEWKAPDFHKEKLLQIALLVFAFGTFFTGRIKKHYLWTLLLPFMYLGLESVRNFYFFGATTGLVYWRMFCEGREDSEPSGPDRCLQGTNRTGDFGAMLLCAALIFSFVYGIATFSNHPKVAVLAREADPAVYPVSIVERIRRGESIPAGAKIFNHYAWGGYLIWKLRDTHKVYIDGRADMYGEKHLEKFKRFLDCRDDGVFADLEKEEIDAVLVLRKSALARKLAGDPFWGPPVDVDAAGALFVPLEKRRADTASETPEKILEDFSMRLEAIEDLQGAADSE